MKFLIPMPLLLLLVVSYPYGVNKTIFTKHDYNERFVIYEGKHDIVDIMVPLNGLNDRNSREHSSEISSDNKDHVIFFIEADTKYHHRRERGIYMYTRGRVTKIMDKGTAMAASYDDSENVYLGAKDGLYIYNPQTQRAKQYGRFRKSIKDIAKEQYTDVIYILTDDGVLYKVYDSATKAVKLDNVRGAEQIMLDYSNNLYYFGKDKKLYVRSADGKTKEIKGIPGRRKDVKLLRPLLFNNEEVGLMIDNKIYTLFSDGSSQPENLEFMPGALPTAFSMEAGIFHYFGYQNKIYEYELSLLEDYEFNGYAIESREA